MVIGRVASCATLFGASQAFAQLAPRPVELLPEPDGTILWNGVAVDDATFAERLAALAKRKSGPEIHILPGRGVSYDGIAHILKLVQPYGFRIGLIGRERAPEPR